AARRIRLQTSARSAPTSPSWASLVRTRPARCYDRSSVSRASTIVGWSRTSTPIRRTRCGSWPTASTSCALISDYGYGVATAELIERLRALRAARPAPLLVDSKDLYRFRHAGATVITPNHLEAWLTVERAHGVRAPCFEQGIQPSEIKRIGRR